VVLAEGSAGTEPLLRVAARNWGAGRDGECRGYCGFRAALKAAMDSLRNDAIRFENLRNRLEAACGRRRGNCVLGRRAAAAEYHAFTVPGMRAETAVIGFDLDGIGFPRRSPALRGRFQPSHVLEAMGFGPEIAQSRAVSLGWSRRQRTLIAALRLGEKLTDTLLKELRRNTA